MILLLSSERKVPGNMRNESLARKTGAGRDGTADRLAPLLTCNGGLSLPLPAP